MVRRYGAYGLRLTELARGQDGRAVDPSSERKGTSAETTFNSDLSDFAALEDRLQPLCEKVAARLRERGWATRIVVLKLKTSRLPPADPATHPARPHPDRAHALRLRRELLRAEARGTAYRADRGGRRRAAGSQRRQNDFFGGEKRGR
jgi:DNA polymerase-4